MSSRTIYSRPRTRVYDVNYNIGESYYKSALDRLDRKYSGRSSTPPANSPSALAADIAERHAAAFADEDLSASRKRAEKRITEENIFDTRIGYKAAAAAEALANGFEDETSAALKRIRANKKVSIIDDVDMESTSSNLKSHRLIDRTEKLLDTVGITDSSRRALDDEIAVKRRSRMLLEDAGAELMKFTPVTIVDDKPSAASLRARQSRERLTDIEDEMAALADKQATRERRLARLKAIVAESEEETSSTQAVKSVSISARSEKKSVRF